MEGVPKDIGQFSRIIGLDLAKKTFKGCILTEEKNFEDRRIITGEMDTEGRGCISSQRWLKPRIL